MFDVNLFLGFPVSSEYRKRLDKINPHLYSRFVNDSHEYLHEIEHEGIRYLGKFVEGLLRVSRRDLLETNIVSMLSRLVPDFSYQDTPLVLIATHE